MFDKLAGGFLGARRLPSCVNLFSPTSTLLLVSSFSVDIWWKLRYMCRNKNQYFFPRFGTLPPNGLGASSEAIFRGDDHRAAIYYRLLQAELN